MNSTKPVTILFLGIFVLLAGSVIFCNLLYAGVVNPESGASEEFSQKSPVRKNKAYAITFTGNKHFSEKELRKAAAAELQMFEKNDYRKADIDDGAFQMRTLYRQAGFAFAFVDYTYEKRENKVFVTFQVDEGPQVFVTNISFVGNRQVGSETLRGFFSDKSTGLIQQQKMVFIESEIKEAANRIRNYYQGEGFIDVVVESPEFTFSGEDRSNVQIQLRITEGSRYFISDVRFTGDTRPEIETELEKIRQDFVSKSYYVRRKLLLRSKLEEVYDAAGYAEAEFDIELVKNGETGLIVMTADITSGMKIMISRIHISGNTSTRDSFIRNRVEFNPGDIYTNAKRRESFRKLFDSGLFSKIDIRLSDEQAEENRDLEIIVEELPTLEVYVEPGWGSYEELRLQAGIFEKSLFGTGRNGRIDTLVHTKGETVTVSYTDPWLMQTDISMNLPLYYERRDEPSYTSEEIGFSALFSRQMSQNLTLIAGYKYKVTQLYSLGDDTVLPKGDEDYKNGTVGIQAVWDTRDDIFYPAAGLRLASGFDISLPAFGSDLEFGRITLGCRYFIELPQEYILGLRATTGLIIPIRDQLSIPISERFFNGGDSTVRSYKHSKLGPKDENNEAVGGLGYNVLSIELRKRFYRNFAASFYVDAGNVSPNSSLASHDLIPYTSRSDFLSDTLTDFFKEFKFGIGVGFQYILPVGPIRFDVAYNPAPEKIWSEDTWVYHFSLGMAF